MEDNIKYAMCPFIEHVFHFIALFCNSITKQRHKMKTNKINKVNIIEENCEFI